MKALKLAAIPAALIATSAFAAEPVVVDQQVVVEPVAVSTTTYNPDAGIVRNTTTQVVSGTKKLYSQAHISQQLSDMSNFNKRFSR